MPVEISVIRVPINPIKHKNVDAAFNKEIKRLVKYKPTHRTIVIKKVFANNLVEFMILNIYIN